jgi:citrate synthase
MPEHARASWLSAEQACEVLGVSRRTLYTYASRGLLRRAASGRESRYLAEDVRRLATRSAARRGRAPLAAAALGWGEPVLDSAITDVSSQRLRYRGHELGTLLERRAGFEAVADLLLDAGPSEWPAPLRMRVDTTLSPCARFVALLPGLERGAEAGELAPRLVIATLARAFAEGEGERIAARLAAGLGLPRRARAAAAIDVALVCAADHELNASTFAARIAASAGASLVACVGAALWVFGGPQHGGSCERVEQLLAAAPRRRLAAWVDDRLARGLGLPGFGHPLYPSGDPRGFALIDHARTLAGSTPALGHALALADAVHDASGLHPTLDFALVALARALAAPPGTAMGLFALGRSAGWLAHALEQRRTRALLRPRARYVGP